LSAANRLTVTGALNKGGAGGLRAELVASAPLPVGSVVTLATFASTDCVPGDFSYSGSPDLRGVFLVGPASLQFLITGAGPTAAYTDWAYRTGCPPISKGRAGPGQRRPDNLLEFFSRVIRSTPTSPESWPPQSSSTVRRTLPSPLPGGSISAA
jgi:hypothetical protein